MSLTASGALKGDELSAPLRWGNKGRTAWPHWQREVLSLVACYPALLKSFGVLFTKKRTLNFCDLMEIFKLCGRELALSMCPDFDEFLWQFS